MAESITEMIKARARMLGQTEAPTTGTTSATDAASNQNESFNIEVNDSQTIRGSAKSGTR
jgi:hypothetical protein